MEFAFLQNNGIELLPRFLTSIAIGLFIGLERERNPSAKAGLRTFALVTVPSDLLIPAHTGTKLTSCFAEAGFVLSFRPRPEPSSPQAVTEQSACR